MFALPIDFSKAISFRSKTVLFVKGTLRSTTSEAGVYTKGTFLGGDFSHTTRYGDRIGSNRAALRSVARLRARLETGRTIQYAA